MDNCLHYRILLLYTIERNSCAVRYKLYDLSASKTIGHFAQVLEHLMYILCRYTKAFRWQKALCCSIACCMLRNRCRIRLCIQVHSSSKSITKLGWFSILCRNVMRKYIWDLEFNRWYSGKGNANSVSSVTLNIWANWQMKRIMLLIQPAMGHTASRHSAIQGARKAHSKAVSQRKTIISQMHMASAEKGQVPQKTAYLSSFHIAAAPQIFLAPHNVEFFLYRLVIWCVHTMHTYMCIYIHIGMCVYINKTYVYTCIYTEHVCVCTHIPINTCSVFSAYLSQLSWFLQMP